MPQYYYAVAGMVVLVAMLLIMRSQKAKASKVAAPTDIHEGWLATNDMSPGKTAWMAADNETKRQTRARLRAEKKAAAQQAAAAKAAAKAEAKAAKSGVPVAAAAALGDVSGKPGRVKRHRRSKNGAPTDLVDAAPLNPVPSLVSEDGWLTTVAAEPADFPAPLMTEPQQPVRDLFQAPASAVPQQFTPGAEAPQYAMAGAPLQHAQAAAEAPRGDTPPAATSFTEIMSAPPAAPAAPQPAAPELPLGPYTFGARNILPGK